MDGRRSALELWQEKLENLLADEAIASDPEKKFQLKIQIREAQQKIAELEAQKKSKRFPDHLQSGKDNPEPPESSDKNTSVPMVKNERKAGFWWGIWHWWIGLKTELKVAVIGGLFAVVVAIVTGICNLGVAIYNGFKASPTPVLSATPMPKIPQPKTATVYRTSSGNLFIEATYDPPHLRRGETLSFLGVDETKL
jgi:hypothetical protein